MKLLVLGASGGCGQWVVRLATERGDDVTALVRPGTPFTPPPGVKAMRGDATDPVILEDSSKGQDAALCCVGQRRAGKTPWARALSPPDLVTRVVSALVPAMEKSGVKRLVFISAGGVGDSADRLTPLVRRMVGAGNVGVAYRDLEEAERVLAKSALDVTCVRPVTLIGGKPGGRAREVSRYGLFSMVRRSDVAQFLVEDARRPGGRALLLGS